MSDCKQILAMLSEYLDRDLPRETCSIVDAHLQSCRDCQDTAARLRETVALCRQFRAADSPGALSADQHEALRVAFETALDALRHGRPESRRSQ